LYLKEKHHKIIQKLKKNVFKKTAKLAIWCRPDIQIGYFFTLQRFQKFSDVFLQQQKKTYLALL